MNTGASRSPSASKSSTPPLPAHRGDPDQASIEEIGNKDQVISWNKQGVGEVLPAIDGLLRTLPDVPHLESSKKTFLRLE